MSDTEHEAVWVIQGSGISNRKTIIYYKCDVCQAEVEADPNGDDLPERH
jgi:hypothetical protein